MKDGLNFKEILVFVDKIKGNYGIQIIFKSTTQ